MRCSAVIGRMKTIRKAKGLTIRELGEKTDISPTRICRFERGERIPDIYEFAKILQAFELPKDERIQLLEEIAE